MITGTLCVYVSSFAMVFGSFADSLRGKFVGAGTAGIQVEKDGRTIPVRINKDTAIYITGKGTPEFIALKRIVRVSGTVKFGNQLEFTKTGIWQVHVNPRESAKPGRAQTSYIPGKNADSLSFNAVITSLNPLKVVPIDTIELLIWRRAGNGLTLAKKRLLKPQTVTITIEKPVAKTVELNLGKNLRRVPPGTEITVRLNQNGSAASEVRVFLKQTFERKDLSPKQNNSKKGKSKKVKKKSSKKNTQKKSKQDSKAKTTKNNEGKGD